MKVNRKELLEAITLLMPGIDKQGVLNQVTECLFFNGENIYSNNLQINVSLPFKTDFSCGVPASEIYKLLQNMKDEEIEIIKDDTTLSVKGKRTKAKIVIVSTDDAPQIKQPTDKWNKLPEDFLIAVDFCRFSASTDTMLGVLSCIFINDNQVISCDNFRGTKYTMKGKLDNSMLLPLAAANELPKYNPIEYIIDDSYIFFRNKDKVIFGCLTMKEEYKDINHIFEIEGNEIAFPSNLIDTLTRADIFAEDKMGKKFIKVVAEENKITCKSEGDRGQIEEIGRIRVANKVEFEIQIKLFSQILERTQQAVVGEGRILFTGGNFQHVLALASND
jgi:DNA polymerase III sliding clamp (beta) subunit (PCNA family)